MLSLHRGICFAADAGDINPVSPIFSYRHLLSSSPPQLIRHRWHIGRAGWLLHLTNRCESIFSSIPLSLSSSASEPENKTTTAATMTDPATQESYPVPDPTIVDPCPATVRNGQCPLDGFTNNHHQQAKTPSQPEPFTTGQEMKITDSVEGEGNFTYICLVWMWLLKVMHWRRVCWEGPWGDGGGIFICVRYF